MKKLVKHLFTFFILANAIDALADNNFLTGIGREQISADLTNNTAVMALVEAGPRNYRASGTFGLALNPCNRVKLTGEWLWQDIDYDFITKTSREWVQQAAVGLGYQFLLNHPIFNYLEINGYYSHAPNKNLIGVDLIQPDGTFVTNIRRIAGSNARGIAPGINFHPWQGAEVNLSVNWDDVVYTTKYTHSVIAQGVGGTAGLKQAIYWCGEAFEIGGLAGFRQPFNIYRAEVNWIKPLPTSQLLLGVFGDYNHGKKGLPNTSLIGINVAYAIDSPTVKNQTQGIQSESLLAWTSKPAVYMPQVLAIEEETINQCTVGSEPKLRGQIPNPLGLPFDASHLFTGNHLTFSALNLAGDDRINPATGIISGSTPATGVVIIASGPCGPKAMSNVFNIA